MRRRCRRRRSTSALDILGYDGARAARSSRDAARSCASRRLASPSAAPLVVVLAASRSTTVEDLTRQGRPDAGRRRYALPTTATDAHLGRPAAVGAVRRRTTRPIGAGARRPVGCCWPSGSAGPRAATSPSTCSWSASATTTKTRRRDRPRADLPVGRVARPGRRRRHLVARRPRGVGQAHRRGLPGPARGRTAVHRDHRQRGGGPPPRPGPRPAARGRRRSRSPSRRCGSCTGSCSCSTPRRRPSWACCRSARRSTTQGYGLDRLRELVLVELATPARPDRHPPVRVARRAVPAGRQGPPTPAWTTRTATPDRARPSTPLRADLFQPEGHRAHRRRSGSATPRCSGCCGTCC